MCSMQKTNQNITLPTQFPLQENKQFEIHKYVAYVKVHTSFAQTEGQTRGEYRQNSVLQLGRG